MRTDDRCPHPPHEWTGMVTNQADAPPIDLGRPFAAEVVCGRPGCREMVAGRVAALTGEPAHYRDFTPPDPEDTTRYDNDQPIDGWPDTAEVPA